MIYILQNKSLDHSEIYNEKSIVMMSEARSLAVGFASLAKNFADDSSLLLFSGIGSGIEKVVGLDIYKMLMVMLIIIKIRLLYLKPASTDLKVLEAPSSQLIVFSNVLILVDAAPDRHNDQVKSEVCISI